MPGCLRVTAFALAILAVLAAAPVATASQPSGLACLQTAQSTAALNDCVGAAYTKARKQLAAAYAKLLARKGFSAADRAGLAAAERKWLQFESVDCSWAEVLNKGGTLAAADRGICLVRDTTDRTQALEDYAATG